MHMRLGLIPVGLAALTALAAGAHAAGGGRITRCSSMPSVESKDNGGRLAGCSRKGSSFGVYDVAAKTGRARARAVGGQADSMKGVIGLGFTGGLVHGYRESLGGEIGATGTTPDTLSLTLSKTTGGLTESHSWAVAVPTDAIDINRSTASIAVDDPLGPGGADGQLNFTFGGRPHLRSLGKLFGCNAKHDVIYGTLTGTIRLESGDRFFKTITITRMTGWAADTYTTGVCLAPCPSPYYSVDGAGPYSQASPVDYLETGGQGAVHRRYTVAVSVFDPTVGTPFVQITHVISAAAATSFVRSNPRLSSAHVSTPGGVLSGSLSLKGSGGLHTYGAEVCRGGHANGTTRYATVTSGAITAAFDAIGKVSLGANLNSPGPGGSRPQTLIDHVS